VLIGQLCGPHLQELVVRNAGRQSPSAPGSAQHPPCGGCW
jgi:hypothetical protein